METEGLLIDFGGTIDTDGTHWYHVFARAYRECGIMDVSDVAADALLRDAYVYAERRIGREHLIGEDFTFRQTLETKLLFQHDYLAEHGLAGFETEPVLNFCYAVAADNINGVSRPVLEKLRGRFPIALVTNFYGNMARVLQEFGLSEMFSAVIESAAAGVSKPDPEIFRMGCRALGLSPLAVTMIGDSVDKDIEPAIIAGCRAIWLKGQGWSDSRSDSSSGSRSDSSRSDSSSGSRNKNVRVITSLSELSW